MSDLRNRIAAILWDTETSCSCDFCVDCCEQLADVLIRELGLRKEIEPYRIADPAQHRHVTDWTADE